MIAIVLFSMAFFGFFTFILILGTECARCYYQAKINDRDIAIKDYWRYLKFHYWRRSTLWRLPLAVLGNGLIVTMLMVFIVMFCSHTTELLMPPGTSATSWNAVLFCLGLSAYSWHVIMPGIYERYIKDQQHRLALILRDKQDKEIQYEPQQVA